MNAETKVKAAKPDPKTQVWDALAKTDPAHTKAFKRAGGFSGTALKPIWVIRKLTEQFGACGEGWGMDAPQFTTEAAPNGELLVYCTLRCWHGAPENSLFGVGGDYVIRETKHGLKADDEAFKKAYTDALMNAFKHVGAGADIHMGLFDDSKYVAEVQEEFHPSPKRPTVSPKEREGDVAPTALGASLKLLVHNLHGCGDLNELECLLDTEDAKDVIEQCARRAPHWYETGEGMPPEFTPLADLIAKRREELSQADESWRKNPVMAG